MHSLGLLSVKMLMVIQDLAPMHLACLSTGTADYAEYAVAGRMLRVIVSQTCPRSQTHWPCLRGQVTRTLAG
jgi:hypothetical protein